MAFDDVADIGRLTIAIGAGNIELTAAVDLAIAVVVSFALEEPLISHLDSPPLADLIVSSTFGNRPIAVKVSAVSNTGKVRSPPFCDNEGVQRS
jgi:hypothetical protein